MVVGRVNPVESPLRGLDEESARGVAAAHPLSMFTSALRFVLLPPPCRLAHPSAPLRCSFLHELFTIFDELCVDLGVTKIEASSLSLFSSVLSVGE